MSSRRHKDRLAGKPPKPKYSPYNKLQKNAALAVSILKVPVSLHSTRFACKASLTVGYRFSDLWELLLLNLGFHHHSSASPLREDELWWWVLSLFL